MIGQLYHCLQHRKLFDEQTAFLAEALAACALERSLELGAGQPHGLRRGRGEAEEFVGLGVAQAERAP
jgi:hypothetical protein